jgi:uncharacterized membrane protein
MESTLYKVSLANKYSGICYSPLTYVYGFGILALLLVKKYFLDRLKVNKYMKVIISFVVSFVVLTLIEYIGGNVLNLIFNIDMWDYTEKSYNFGKYICLELALIWALLGTLYIYYIKGFVDKIIAIIPKKLTITVVIISLIDVIITLFNKL